MTPPPDRKRSFRRLWQRIATRLWLSNTYDPARHYMRGPGPASQRGTND
ncbi:hypothetical protein [Mesobacterium pallidum]|nr:hypothetical protein [Mesobacterium pallidum]